jgi:hypothetical protein
MSRLPNEEDEMKMVWSTVLAAVLLTVALTPASVSAQLPGVGSLPSASSLMPDKAALLEQGKKLLADLTAMKQDPKLPAADKTKVDTLIPKATAVNTELAKPEVEPSRLTKLAGQLGDLQKQYASLKGMGN